MSFVPSFVLSCNPFNIQAMSLCIYCTSIVYCKTVLTLSTCTSSPLYLFHLKMVLPTYLPMYCIKIVQVQSLVVYFLSKLSSQSFWGGAAQTKNLIGGEDTNFWLLYKKRGKKRRRRSSNKDTLKKVELLRKYYRDNFVYSFFRNETLC